ncbi:MAG TPA: hypothetical protein VJV05_04550, partial [Pyrinomonadaceae bacterium]|nr:hypothetical protein [Pyrinomonadaceae bacterium]
MRSLTRIAFFVFIFVVVASARTTYNFNSDWRVFVGDPAGAEAVSFDDSGWKAVTLPRPWNE